MQSTRFALSRFTLLLVALFILNEFDQRTIASGEETVPPNIVFILADDMGFGEVQHLNPDRGLIPTPQLDSLAQNGMIFTDAHSGSSVCTPTRYGLLTGRYAWRTRLQKGVLTGGESLIGQDRLTVAKLLKQAGYETAIIGKWHLGMMFDGQKIANNEVAIGSKVTQGPIDRGGFDLFYGFHHSRQMEVWIENDIVTQKIQPIEMLPKLTEKAVEYIQGRKDNEQPFFLYIPWNSPHSPVVPSREWQGKSGLNAHADFVMQTDDCFGQVIDALEQNDLLENTLVICTADNGTSGPTSKMEQLKQRGHYSSGKLRGSKADIWDGGHRVPFIAHWPRTIPANSRCDELVCLNDFMATVAELNEIQLPADAGEDSFSFLQLLRGEPDGTRTSVIHHSSSGKFAIRKGDWKLIFCSGSGGWTAPKDKQATASGAPPSQLYDMRKDVSERSNLIAQQAEKVDELRSLLKEQIKRGRSTPGEEQSNDVEVVFE